MDTRIVFGDGLDVVIPAGFLSLDLAQVALLRFGLDPALAPLPLLLLVQQLEGSVFLLGINDLAKFLV